MILMHLNLLEVLLSSVFHHSRDLQIYSIQREKIHSQFPKVTTREEIFETTKLSDAIFGGHIDVDRQLAWLDKNPDIMYIVKSEDKVVGYVIILPLHPQKIEKLLKRKSTQLISNPKKSKPLNRASCFIFMEEPLVLSQA
jgi:fumarylacetoacetate (FAA) hydrolase family protein